jgi:hypothetical protein
VRSQRHTVPGDRLTGEPEELYVSCEHAPERECSVMMRHVMSAVNHGVAPLFGERVVTGVELALACEPARDAAERTCDALYRLGQRRGCGRAAVEVVRNKFNRVMAQIPSGTTVQEEIRSATIDHIVNEPSDGGT